MESYTYDQLKDMTVVRLREIADGIQHEALEGHSTMHKEQLLPALCKAMGIEVHHVAVGKEKAHMKAAIRALKAKRDATSGDPAKSAALRGQIHALKHKLRRMARSK